MRRLLHACRSCGRGPLTAILAAAVWGALLVSACTRAEEPRAVESPGASPPQSPEILAQNVQELRSRVGQQLRVTGEVSRVGKSTTGHRFLNFVGNPELTVFIDARDVDKFRPDTPEQRYAGKSIEVTGNLERFQGKLQIPIRDPGAIRLIEKERGPPPPAQPRAGLAPVELRAVGRDSWVSPAGLQYVGRDPDGNTRKEHVLRHARDLPRRAGSHGVFDGGEELAFAWIDAAWKRVQEQQLRPQVEEGRDVYNINMGKRVGFLGGETGARTGQPPLQHIFLVLRHGTTEVITAFPK